MNERNIVESGRTALGIEFGSTRIKAVLSDYEGHVLASGAYDWENQLIDGIWTYALEDVLEGMKCCYSALRADVAERYGIRLCTVGVIGISAMMHGYIATDAVGNQLAPFQTWRNTNTLDAAARLTELFSYNIPDRWSVAHLYQRILDGEEHVRSIASVDTLSAWVHRLLTGKHVLGVGDASGMFPIDTEKKDYNERMVQQFTELIAGYNYPWNLREIFPKVLTAGEDAGCLTEEGAALLDPTGTLKPGIPFCPPEGDAGTVMNTAGEGGAWGIALLAAYRMCREPEETLEAFLENRIFQDMSGSTLLADEQEQAGSEKFMENYKNGIAVERTAVDLLW